jgi:hypothetical protein
VVLASRATVEALTGAIAVAAIISASARAPQPQASGAAE